jgi:hypothetical protein
MTAKLLRGLGMGFMTTLGAISHNLNLLLSLFSFQFPIAYRIENTHTVTNMYGNHGR